MPARALFFRVLKPLGIKKDANRPQNELQSDPKVTPESIPNRYFSTAGYNWRVKVGLQWSKIRKWHQKVTKYHPKITNKQSIRQRIYQYADLFAGGRRQGAQPLGL